MGVNIDSRSGNNMFQINAIVSPDSRPDAFVSESTHARIRHDYATWHSDYLDKILRKKSLKIPYENKSKFDSASIISDAINRRKTSCATVVLKQTGEVVTVFPGKPEN